MSHLSPQHIHALFDILTHYETYAEIENFKTADAITQYGYPFSPVTKDPSASTDNLSPSPSGSGFGFSLWGRSAATTPAASRPTTPKSSTPLQTSTTGSPRGKDDVVSTSPLLQMMLTKFVLPIPGIRDLPRDMWSVRVQGIIARLGAAELSESYDKGALGARKTLATGASVMMENVGRGILGGAVRSVDKAKTGPETYDHTKAEDLIRGWNDVVEQFVYGDLTDGLFKHLAETDDLDAYSPTIRAAVDYAIFHLSTLFHSVFIQSPEGQYLLKLMENVNNLVPYKMIAQTLRIGNAATMINGMMRLLLAKLSVTSITNWVGLTANADDGMNLLQRIISLVLSWDASEFKKIVEKTEKAKDGPTPEMLKAIRDFVKENREEHELVRSVSMKQPQSIIVAILNSSNPELATSLTEDQHAQCLAYYSALLSVRDRDCIASALCRQSPDLFTKSVKDSVAAYEPIIRSVHERVDLKDHFEGLQAFIQDFIKTSTPKDGGSVSIEDYVAMCRRNRNTLHKWMHSLGSQCPDVWEDFRVYMNDSVQQFRQRPTKDSNSKYTTRMDEQLNMLYSSLDEATQESVLAAVDAHATYLSTLSAISEAKLNTSSPWPPNPKKATPTRGQASFSLDGSHCWTRHLSRQIIQDRKLSCVTAVT